eukprot:GGOE01019856.1.p1 GENE.GGOE01019856.1~~GGOE01019856.1.p1  ORF type:complete len:909 (-),score=229.43 GGOE01019856.1:58-2784(-)
MAQPGRPNASLAGAKTERRLFPAKLTGPNAVPPKENRIDATRPLPPVATKELEKGILSCVNRGFIPPMTDVTSALSFGHPLPAISTVRPPALEPEERYDRKIVEVGPMFEKSLKLDREAGVPQWPMGHPLSEGYTPFPKGQPLSPPRTPSPDNPYGFELMSKDLKDSSQADLYVDIGAPSVGPHATEVVICRGRTADTTHAFVQFQEANQENWGSIVSMMRALERLCERFAIPMALLNTKRVAYVAMADLEEPSLPDLLSCFINEKEVRTLLQTPGQRYRSGSKGRVAAAITLQSAWRRYSQQIRFTQLVRLTKASRIIQAAWARLGALLKTRSLINEARDARLEEWRVTMATFLEEWPRIRRAPRVIIHLPSLSYAVAQAQNLGFYHGFQTAQMAGRLCDLLDPNVSVVYITPRPVERAVVQYYMKMLLAHGVRGLEDRLTFLHPEVMDRVPPDVSLAKGVWWSARLQQQLREITRDQDAYIVPGKVGPEDVELAIRLNLPLLSANPVDSPSLFSKSGRKKVIEESGVPTPTCVYDICDDAAMVDHMAFLIVHHPDCPRWLLKLNREFGGRGIAYLDVHRLKAMQNVDWESVDRTELQANIALELKEYGSKRFKVAQPALFSSWANFLKELRHQGALLEATPPNVLGSPTVHLFLHPTGEAEVLAVQEQILSPHYCCQGTSYPVPYVESGLLAAAAREVAVTAFDRGVIGFCTMDFVAFREGDQLRLWVVDIKWRQTDHGSIHRVAHMVCKEVSPSDALPLPVGRCYYYSGLICHPRIRAIDHVQFFQACKAKGISFQVELCSGIVLHLVGSLEQGCLGLLCIGAEMADALASLSVGVAFMQDCVGGRGTGQDSGHANIHHVVAACRTLNGGRLLGPDGRPKGGPDSGTPTFARPHGVRSAATALTT